MPVILDPALAVEAEILGARAVGQLADVLGADRVQPAAPVGSGQRDDRAVGPVDHDGAVLGGALLAERITVVPDRSGVGRVLRGRGRLTHINSTEPGQYAVTPCPGSHAVLVTLDGEVHDPAEPLLFADDLAAVRGDGVFETLLVRDGRACLVEPHLRRLVQSATMMDLPEPDLPAWRSAIEVAVGQWTAQTARRGRAAAGVQPGPGERLGADRLSDRQPAGRPGGRHPPRRASPRCCWTAGCRPPGSMRCRGCWPVPRRCPTR